MPCFQKQVAFTTAVAMFYIAAALVKAGSFYDYAKA
jgi:hypothetical protein